MNGEHSNAPASVTTDQRCDCLKLRHEIARLQTDLLGAKEFFASVAVRPAPQDPASIVLADGHTTVKEAFEVANEMHEMAEEEANSCNDGIATALSKGAAIMEMLAAKLAEGRS